MRTVLVTGPGGAGRTTVAAATALAAARQGQRVLLLTSDRGPTPEAVLGTALPAGPAQAEPWSPPVQAAPGLWAARIAVAEHFTARARELQERGTSLFDLLGAAPLDPEELTELPGAEPLALLTALRTAHARPDRDLLVVDLPPDREAIRLLALPEQLRRYLRRLLPPERQAARALRPMLAQLAGLPAPAQRLYETAERWDAELAAVQQVIEAETTTVRLVAEPGPPAVAALRATRAGLALHGCRVDALVLNRLLPPEAAGESPWLAGLAAEQATAAKALREECHPVPVTTVPHLGRTPRGPADLAALLPGPLPAGPAGSADPAESAVQPWTVEDRLDADGLLIWKLPLPGADRDGLGLVRRGDELILAVGEFRRILPLPSALRRCSVAGAGLRDGALCVRFVPDPALWPRTR
ncbi:ArsA family ATPase [Streptomyces orinoci]|uniref:ArsA-related P-loop ATPase n=1 Tax=Streptomyces orinoci TaxID=67339 RepID=A0ABV3JVV1_STRON|nr:ArsA-related P-loop ATPase [Streptomyces orinoci]